MLLLGNYSNLATLHTELCISMLLLGNYSNLATLYAEVMYSNTVIREITLIRPPSTMKD